MATYSGFHDVIFPVPVARGARVTTQRQTEIVTLGSGHEERNTRWRYAKRTYDAGGGVRSRDDLYRVQSFFEARFGQLYAFRFRDPLDHASCDPSGTPAPTDQALGMGDGTKATFQLVKSYGPSSLAGGTAERAIKLPVDGSVTVAVDGTPKTTFTLDATTGTVTFHPGSIPANGAAVSAGFLYDVPARFDTNTLDIDMTAFTAGALPTIPLREVFLKEVSSA